MPRNKSEELALLVLRVAKAVKEDLNVSPDSGLAASCREARELAIQVLADHVVQDIVANGGNLADITADDMAKRYPEKPPTRKKREVLNWQMEIPILLETLTPGAQRGAWKKAAEERAGKAYSTSTFNNLIRIMKGEGPSNRKIEPLVTQSGTRATATYQLVESNP